MKELQDRMVEMPECQYICQCCFFVFFTTQVDSFAVVASARIWRA